MATVCQHAWQPDPSQPPKFFKVSFIIIITIINGGLVANSDAQTAEKSGQESTTWPLPVFPAAGSAEV